MRRTGHAVISTLPIAENIRAICAVEQAALDKRSPAQRVSDAVSRALGSAFFGILHLVWFAAWIGMNTYRPFGVTAFDPYPFGLLTMVVSLEAIFLTIMVLISQNRMTMQADRRAHLDLQVNLLAEQEATAMLRMLERITVHLGLPVEDDTDILATRTDVEQLVTELDEKLPSQ
jgi:uncharacterized membrane protein